jgi:phasin
MEINAMDDTNASAKVKTAASLPIMPLFGLPRLEVPAALREAAENGAAQAKDACEKARAATEQATDLIEETYAIAVKGTVDYNLKVFAVARASLYAAFDFTSELAGVTSLSAAVELTTTHARMQLEAVAERSRELAAAAQKLGIETAAPIKTGLAKAFRTIA